MTAEPLKPVSEPTQLSARWIRFQPWIAAGVLVLGILNAFRLPYYSLGPGPATDVLEVISITDGQVYESDGDLLLTTASLSNNTLTIAEYLWTLADKSLATIPAELILDGGSDTEADERNQFDMAQSKLDAELAAFAALGMNVRTLQGANILSVFDSANAAGVLEPGDRIVAIAGKRISGTADVREAYADKTVGETVKVKVVRDGKRIVEKVKLSSTTSRPNDPRLGIAVATAYEFPVKVDIDTMRVGGPSGGLVFALALVELLGEEDLTRSRSIAVTGTIAMVDGVARVGSVGGIENKIYGAEKMGAKIFIVPMENLQAAISVAPDNMKVVGVSTLDEALEVLRQP